MISYKVSVVDCNDNDFTSIWDSLHVNINSDSFGVIRVAFNPELDGDAKINVIKALATALKAVAV